MKHPIYKASNYTVNSPTVCHQTQTYKHYTYKLYRLRDTLQADVPPSPPSAKYAKLDFLNWVAFL